MNRYRLKNRIAHTDWLKGHGFKKLRPRQSRNNELIFSWDPFFQWWYKLGKPIQNVFGYGAYHNDILRELHIIEKYNTGEFFLNVERKFSPEGLQKLQQLTKEFKRNTMEAKKLHRQLIAWQKNNRDKDWRTDNLLVPVRLKLESAANASRTLIFQNSDFFTAVMMNSWSNPFFLELPGLSDSEWKVYAAFRRAVVESRHFLDTVLRPRESGNATLPQKYELLSLSESVMKVLRDCRAGKLPRDKAIADMPYLENYIDKFPDNGKIPRSLADNAVSQHILGYELNPETIREYRKQLVWKKKGELKTSS